MVMIVKQTSTYSSVLLLYKCLLTKVYNNTFVGTTAKIIMFI